MLEERTKELAEVFEDLLSEAYEILGEDRYRLVKGKRSQKAKPDIVVTAFHHFSSVATSAAKICSILEEKGVVPEETYRECFWGGFAHDYEKVWENFDKVEEVLKRIRGININTIEKLASCAESLMGLPSKKDRFMCYVLMLSDYWASQRSLTSWYPSTDERYLTALQQLEKKGLRFVPVFSGIPKAVMAAASEKLLGLFIEKGWFPLFVYADGILLVGDETSQGVSRDEIAEVLFQTLARELSGGESQKAGMEKGLKVYLQFASRVAQFIGSVDEDEVNQLIESALNKGDSNKKKDLLAAYAASLIDGKLNLAKKIAEIIKNNKKKLQVAALLGKLYYFEEIEKAGLQSALREFAEGKDELEKTAIASFVKVFKHKGKTGSELARSYIEYPWAESKQRHSYSPLVYAETFYVILKNKLYDKVLNEVSKGAGASKGLELYAKYLACEELSSPILKGECILPKPKHKCFICGGPVYSDEFTFEKYYGLVFGKPSGGVEIYTPRQIPFMDIEKAKKGRYICPGCAYEGAFVGKRLSVPFISYALQPSVSYELMKYFIAKKITPFASSTLRDLCFKKFPKDGSPEDFVIDYSHALTLLKMSDLKRDEKGFDAKSAAIARFLAKAGSILESGGGGQVALTWELPQYIASEPVSAPQLPGWVVELLELSLGSADSLAPLIHGLKAWTLKVCKLDTKELREAFFSSSLSPHPSLALLAPPRGFKEELEKKYLKIFLLVLEEVILMENHMKEEDRLVPKLWAYAYAIRKGLRGPPSKHKVQSPLRTALYRLVEYMEMGLKDDDVIEMAAAAAQEDVNRKIGNVSIEGPVKSILKFVKNYVKEMNPSKRRQFFEDILDVAYLLTLKAKVGGEEK